jgi:proline racemase
VIHLVRTIDAHAGGQPLRLIVEGVPPVSGATFAQRIGVVRRRADHLRKALVLPPRGERDMIAALLLEPTEHGAHAAVLFMDAAGYRVISGQGAIAVATIAIERGLLFDRDAPDAAQVVVFETVAGPVRAQARIARGPNRRRVDSIALSGPPAFVLVPGHVVSVGSRELRVDVAFGGLFYAIADTEAVGIPLTDARVPELRRLAIDLTQSVNASLRASHPALPISGISGVVFTGPPHDPEAHLRAVAVTGTGVVNWSPGATAMSAVMSVLDAMQLLDQETAFVQEGLSGALFRGRIAAHTAVGETPAIQTEIEGSAWITGEHTFVIDDEDPFREGMSRT